MQATYHLYMRTSHISLERQCVGKNRSYCLHQNICFGHGQFEMVSQIYLFQYIWYRMLWIVCSEETDIISTLMMTFLLMNILCMHESDIMVLTACVM